MKRNIAAVVIASVMAGPLAAQRYPANGRLVFTPLENGVRIEGDTGNGAGGIWCAAADYARDELGARSDQDLYVSEPRIRGLGHPNAVSFTLDPTGLTPVEVLIVGPSLNRQGSRLSVGHALSFCPDLYLPSR
ncbi:hypothetical protein SAMN04488040_1558 [Sulfitobacter marinus]|uniref:Uncharacterized protein n=1 Tax=Sulfitobacter marinus TaxID=394264 RepID=A0A1I6RVE4_9RHOB|nr:hypothetical protein [Sulfitobacter marinus]SFS68679.1 hypothetical protein SAMN04488040_1558 [Sulfitobacter marinus]